MEVTEPTIGIFYASKILALAPFSVHRNTKGVLEIRRSLMFTVYSISLCLIMVFLTYRGLLFDANSKIPVRMKSATSKVVTALDVSVVVLATTAGVCCGLLGLKSTRELNMRLKKIDDSLHPFTNFKRDRVKAQILLALPLACIVSLLVLDIWTWLRNAEDMKIENENTELNVQWYIPFYSLYIVLTGLHITLANTAFGLGRRFRRLNLMLRSTFLKEKQKEAPTKPPKITTVKVMPTYTLPVTGSLNLQKTQMENSNNDASCKNKVRLLRVLAENHDSLCKCVMLASSTYGVAVLFILVSCLLHLVATAYFLFLEILSKKDSQYLWLQILWILFHTLRLLMIVEPCHLATRESKKTVQIVCEIERKAHDPILSEEAKKFWQQLLVLHSDFSASGLCKVNRNILTSESQCELV